MKELLQLRLHRQEAGPHRLAQKEAARFGQREELPRLGCVGGEGLLAEHMPPRLQRQLGVLVVVGMRGSDVDQLHLLIRHQLPVGAVGARDAMLLCEAPGARKLPRAHRQYLAVRHPGHCLCHLVRDLPRAQYPDFHAVLLPAAPSGDPHGLLHIITRQAETGHCLLENISSFL